MLTFSTHSHGASAPRLRCCKTHGSVESVRLSISNADPDVDALRLEGPAACEQLAASLSVTNEAGLCDAALELADWHGVVEDIETCTDLLRSVVVCTQQLERTLGSGWSSLSTHSSDAMTPLTLELVGVEGGRCSGGRGEGRGSGEGRREGGTDRKLRA